MEAKVVEKDNVAIFIFSGRMDTRGAVEAGDAFQNHVRDGLFCAVFDMSGVSYLSSAGVRIFLSAHQELRGRGGNLVLSGPAPYAMDVLKLTGLLEFIPVFDDRADALAFCRKTLRGRYALDNWDNLETAREECGAFRFIRGSMQPAKATVLGCVEDVLKADITSGMVWSLPFAEAEYSFGLGGLGGAEQDYFNIMGEMLTIGGAMVWLPADGGDVPDFLIPRRENADMRLHTPFNVSIPSAFNEYAVFESATDAGTKLSELYKALFRLSAGRRPDYTGVLGLAAWADMVDVYGAGIKIAPVSEKTPQNKALVTDPSNVGLWFERDAAPRHTNTSCLLCGLGADPDADLSGLDRDALEAVFYASPGEDDKRPPAERPPMLHTHGAVVAGADMPERMVDLDEEIKKVLEKADIVDMRHMLSASRVRRAFLGICHIREIRRDAGRDIRKLPVDIGRLRSRAMARYLEVSGKTPRR